jgi:RND family efflux transporter MFP subunit
MLIVGAVALGSLSALWASQFGAEGPSSMSLSKSGLRESALDSREESALPVEVVRPTKGGLARKIVQTGSVEAFETAELYVHVAGYLKSIAVDIGDQVSEGQVLAEIDAPELARDVAWKQALCEQAQSRVLQAQARVKTARVERLAADGLIEQADAEVLRKSSERGLCEKELARIRELVAQKAIESKLVDEKQHAFESAKAGEDHARASARIAQAEIQTLDSRIEQSQADLVVAEADLRVAQADLARAQAVAEYAIVTAPFSGTVIERNWDRGAYVHSAKGGEKPLLTLARTERMRVVIRIAAPDVPVVRVGQTAIVAIDALGGETFLGNISRISCHQDSKSRTMRAEIDLPNLNGRLTSGMYATATVSAPPSPDCVLVPRECLAGRAQNGRGQVYVLIDGRAQLRNVGLGASDDNWVEILWNLSPNELILAHGSELPAGLRDGFAVNAVAIRKDPRPLLTGDPHSTLQANR